MSTLNTRNEREKIYRIFALWNFWKLYIFFFLELNGELNCDQFIWSYESIRIHLFYSFRSLSLWRYNNGKSNRTRKTHIHSQMDKSDKKNKDLKRSENETKRYEWKRKRNIFFWGKNRIHNPIHCKDWIYGSIGEFTLSNE